MREASRATLIGLAVLLAGCVALAVVLVNRNDDGTTTPTADRVERGPVTPNFIGQRRTQVICAMRGSAAGLVVDGYAEQPERRVYDAICERPRLVGVDPDPPVQRQSPPPGAPLENVTTIRVWTPCFQVGCA